MCRIAAPQYTHPCPCSYAAMRLDVWCHATYGIGGYARLAKGYAPMPRCGILDVSTFLMPLCGIIAVFLRHYAAIRRVGIRLIYLTGYAGDGFGRHVGVEVYRRDSVGDEVAALVDAPLHANLTGFVV